jgi:hypothetical protein
LNVRVASGSGQAGAKIGHDSVRRKK